MITWNEILFILCGTHKNFDLIKKNDTGIPSQLRTGDLLLRKIYAHGPYHVGIYCGKYVLEFTAPENSEICDRITSFSSTKQSGPVNMKSVKNFIANKPYRVLRLKMDIPQNFSDLVEAHMDYAGVYHPLTNNCLHFALRLLGLKTGSIPKSLPRQRDEEIAMDDLGERGALTDSQQHGTEVNLTL